MVNEILNYFGRAGIILMLSAVTILGQQNWKSPEVLKRELESKYRMAVQYEQRGQAERALKLYRDIFNRNPRNHNYYTRYANQLFKQELYSELEMVIHRYLESKPRNETALIDLGKLYYLRGDTTLAQQYWQENWEKRNYSQSYMRLLFNCLISLKEYDQAEDIIRQVREHYHRPDLFAIELANFQMMRQNYLESAEEFLLFGRQNPRNSRYISNRILQFPLDSALFYSVDSLIRMEISDSRKSPELHTLRADLLFRYKHYQEAIKEVLTVESLKKYRGEDILNMALDLQNVGEFNLAEQVYMTIIGDMKFRNIIPKALLGLADAFEKEVFADNFYSPFDYFYRGNFFFKPEYTYGVDADNVHLRQAFSIYDSMLVTFSHSDYMAEVLIRLGELRYRVLQDIDGAARFYSDAMNSTRNAGLKGLCLTRLVDLRIAKGDLAGARNYIEMNSLISESLEKELALRKLLILYYSAELDSIPIYVNDVLGLLGINDPYFNDVIEFQNFTDQFISNENREAAHDFLRSELLIRQNKLSEAQRVLIYLLENYPDSEVCIPARYRLLQIELFFKDRTEAENILNALISDENQFAPDALLMMGEIAQYRDHDDAYAAQWYYTLLERYPQSLMSDDVRKRLRNIQAESTQKPEL